MKRNIVVFLVIALLVGMIPDTGISAKASHVKLKKAYGVKVIKTTYASQSKKIAAVTAKGKVRARKRGTTCITVTVKYKRLGRQYVKKFLFTAKVVEIVDLHFELYKNGGRIDPTSAIKGLY